MVCIIFIRDGNPNPESTISVPDSDSTDSNSNFFSQYEYLNFKIFHVKINVKSKVIFMEVKCFVICTDLLLPLLFLNSNIYVIKIRIRISNAKNMH